MLRSQSAGASQHSKSTPKNDLLERESPTPSLPIVQYGPLVNLPRNEGFNFFGEFGDSALVLVCRKFVFITKNLARGAFVVCMIHAHLIRHRTSIATSQDQSRPFFFPVYSVPTDLLSNAKLLAR